MKALKTTMLVILSLVFVTGAVAEDAKKGEKGKAAATKNDGAAKKGDAARKGAAKKRGERKAPSVTARLVGKLDLSAEQKEKVAAIDKEFAAKAAEVRKAQSAVLTKEQIETRNAVMKKARESKDKSPEARKAVQKSLKDAVNLSDEQKAKMVAVQKSQRELNGAVLAALKKVLTEEQIKNLPGAGRGKGKRPEGGKKPAGDRKKKEGGKKPEAAAKKDGAK